MSLNSTPLFLKHPTVYKDNEWQTRAPWLCHWLWATLVLSCTFGTWSCLVDLPCGLAMWISHMDLPCVTRTVVLPCAKGEHREIGLQSIFPPFWIPMCFCHISGG